MSEPYTPTESELIAASIGTGYLLSARRAQKAIARIKAEAKAEHEGTVEELLETLDLLTGDGEGWSIAGESARLLREQAARIAELEAQVPRIKAEALREAADSHEIKDNRPWVEWWLTDRANRIEKETT